MRAITYAKMGAAAIVCCVGGPALVFYLQPDPDELFSRYNPDLQKKALAGREKRLADHQEYVRKLKEYSKSDRPIWVVAAEVEAKEKKAAAAQKKLEQEELKRQRQEILEQQRK